MSGYNFTDAVRESLQQAREIAAARQNEYVGPEHILLGILADPDESVTSILQKLQVTPELLTGMVEAIAKPGDRPTGSGPELPYTTRAKKALELSMLEARELGDDYVGTEHLLLGLIREEKGIAAQVLGAAGVSRERAREALGPRMRPFPPSDPRARREAHRAGGRGGRVGGRGLPGPRISHSHSRSRSSPCSSRSLPWSVPSDARPRRHPRRHRRDHPDLQPLRPDFDRHLHGD